MQLSIVGTGYVGLVTGTCLAEIGNDVVCLDINEEKVRRLNDGQIPIYEPGLEKLVQNNFQAQRIRFTNDWKEALRGSEIVMLCVGTPQDEDGSADLNQVLSAARSIGQLMQEDKIIVVKSTVPVGTCHKVQEVIQEELNKRNSKLHFDVASNPEFLKEGAAVGDFMRPDRIVVGANQESTKKKLSALYAPFIRNGYRVVEMDVKSSEMTKYSSNAMLATKISFMNEISKLCDQVGADVEMVRQGMGTDKRIGFYFTYPGIGYGGSCFPKDVRALVRIGKQNNTEMEILKAVDLTNDNQRILFVDRIINYFGGNVSGKTFAVWGLSFKPETDDIREAPALHVIQSLVSRGARVKAYDPIAIENTRKEIGEEGIEYMKDQYEVLKDADALLIHTDWKPFKSPNFEKIKSQLKTAIIFDGRNLYDPEVLKEHKISYHTMGRLTYTPLDMSSL